ncbi:MAG TPA: A24 family peptidase [Terriglobales bacterium]|nr:A24 family peptidase [Terriglobales bacterium]
MATTAAALALAGAAAVCDWAWRRVPNWLTVPALAAGLGWSYVGGREVTAVAAAVAGLAVGLMLWRLGALGAGDAKLLAALGALLGWRQWFWSLAFGLLAAAAMAVVQLRHRGRLAALPRVAGALIQGWGVYGLRPHPQHNATAPDAVTAPFAVPLALGVVCAVLLAPRLI